MFAVRLFSVAALVCVAGCQNFPWGQPGVKGDGQIVSKLREVPDFNQIVFEGGGILEYTCGADVKCEVTVDGNLQELVKTEVEGGRLKIWNTENISPSKPLKIVVSSPRLQSVAVVGSCQGSVANLNEENFDLKISGSGAWKLAGQCPTLAVSITGSGKVAAEELTAKQADVSIAGSGNVDLNASEVLNVSISGSGQVSYVGSPKVTSKVAGSGKVTKKADK